MSAAEQRAARVSVDYSQYQVAAGSDIEEGDYTIPGLLLGQGPQAVAVITGMQFGKVTVTVGAVRTPPADIDPGWDVVAETDLESPEGTIAVYDWAGPAHDELGELAIAGPGLYRLRVHARNREQARGKHTEDRGKHTDEEHHLLLWPAAQRTPPRLLTPMDAYGRVFDGEPPPDVPPLDALDRAAAAAVKRLADLVNQPRPPQVSGQLTEVHAQTIVPATPRKVWNHVSKPWLWLGNQDGADRSRFDIYLHWEPWLEAQGGFVADEPLTHLAFTWSWSTTRQAETSAQVPNTIDIDLVTGESTNPTKTVRATESVPSWILPPKPTTVHIHLSRHGKGTTVVELDQRELPAELADAAQPFWDWALRELGNRLTGAPFYGYPWNR